VQVQVTIVGAKGKQRGLYPPTLLFFLAVLLLVTPPAADGDDSDLHKAVRAGALDQIETLFRGHADINVKDDMGRTPLTLALQLGEHPVAKMLLAWNATINLTTDVDFIDGDLAPYFRTALLRDQLITLGNGDPQNAAKAFLADLARNQMTAPSKSIWQYKCDNCLKPAPPSPNPTISNAICAVRPPIQDSPALISSNQWIFGSLLKEPVVSNICHITYKYSPSAILTVPKCQAGTTAAPCFPQFVVENKGGTSPLSLSVTPFVRSDLATCPQPEGVSFQGNTAVLPVNTRLTVDRSLGDVKIEASLGSSETFNLAFIILIGVPPNIDVSTDLDLLTRLSTYIRLASMAKIYDDSLVGKCQSDNLNRIGADTTRRAISANAVIREYAAHVKEELVDLALDISQLNDDIVALNKVLAANASLPPEQISLMLTQINMLLSNTQLNADDRKDLEQIRDELKAAQGAVGDSTAALKVFHDKFSSYAEYKLFQYQGDVLEYAQFFPISDLTANSVLSPSTRTHVQQKISNEDVVITDDAVGGKGKVLRAAFGLPDPAIH
jgi:hypothetical protein